MKHYDYVARCAELEAVLRVLRDNAKATIQQRYLRVSDHAIGNDHYKAEYAVKAAEETLQIIRQVLPE